MGDEVVVDVASCLRYGYNYVVISIEDAVRLIDTANALEAIEVQVAIPPHVGAKDYETIVKLLARSKFTRMKVVNPRDPSQIRAIIHRIMETIMEKPQRIKLIIVSSMVEVLNVEAMSGVQYHIAFPDSFPHQRQASIACVAYSRGFKVINGPFATPSPPARITPFWGHLCKLILKTDWTSFARITIRWMPLVVLLASGAYKGCTRRSKTETLEATSAAIDVTHNKETASWLIEEDSANYMEIKGFFFEPIRIDEHSPEPLQDFRKFMEDFVMRFLKKTFSIDGSTLEEVVFKLCEDYDKFSEAPEFKEVELCNWDDVNFHDLKHCGRFFINFAVAFVETAVEHFAKLSDKHSRKS